MLYPKNQYIIMTTNQQKTIFLAVFLSIVSVSTAQEYTIDGLRYSLIETDGITSAQVEQHPGRLQGSITIPSTVNIEEGSYTVTSINDFAFDGDEITFVKMPNTIVSIGVQAFGNCKNLTSVNLSSSLKTIGYGAFSGSGLYSITIPKSVNNIDKNIVVGCENLESIIVESGNTTYDSRNNCDAVIEKENNSLIFGCKNTNIPNDVESIGPYAFINCKNLTQISFPSSLSWIGYNAFTQCTRLTSIDFPEGVRSVGDNAFEGCSSLTYLYIPERLTYSGDYAFMWFGGLLSIYVHP